MNLKAIIEALDHSDFYARDMESVQRETGLSKEDIEKLIEDEPINIFKFGGTCYIGTECRKRTYDQDKKLGINPFEMDTYKGDEYRDKFLNGQPRFRGESNV